MSDYSEITSLLTQPQANRPYADAVSWVRRVAQAIERSDIVPGMTVRVMPGHETNVGQQLNVVLSIGDADRPKLRETLFRAYVPESGTPVSLDFYGDELVPVRNESELQDQIKDFVQTALSKRLMMLRESFSLAG